MRKAEAGTSDLDLLLRFSQYRKLLPPVRKAEADASDLDLFLRRSQYGKFLCAVRETKDGERTVGTEAGQQTPTKGAGDMALITYKCPNCGGTLTFHPELQKFQCEYCLSEFTEQEMDELSLVSTEQSDGSSDQDAGTRSDSANPDFSDGAVLRKEGDSGKAEEMAFYICPSCGAQIIAGETTAATFCYYCHSPVVLEGRLSGEFRPDFVLPFVMDRKKAEEIFLNWIEKKKFVPKSFLAREQIEKMTGVYFPYLIYSCTVDGNIRAEGERQRTWTAGNIRYTEHRKYQLERGGELYVNHVARNALKRNNSTLVEGVLPFDMEKMVPFQPEYLSGFQAEKRDMDESLFTPEVEEEVKSYTVQNLMNSLEAYSPVRIKESKTVIHDAKWQYALLPVWVLTYRSRDKGTVYYFAMNGQTGKVCGRLPVDKRRLGMLFLAVFLPVFLFLLAGGWFL